MGLGKTIEAGLVVQEMVLRHRVQILFLIVAVSLQLQWRDEMRDKFGLEFRIVDSEGISQLRRKRGIHVNPWGHFPRLITSIDFLKRERIHSVVGGFLVRNPAVWLLSGFSSSPPDLGLPRQSSATPGGRQCIGFRAPPEAGAPWVAR